MRRPLLYTILWSHNVEISSFNPLDLVEVGSLEFDSVSTGKYPNMDVAYFPWRKYGTMTCVFNAAI